MDRLVTSSWLEKELGAPDLRILDCTVIYKPTESGLEVNSGLEAWEAGHIPGSRHVDLRVALSDPSTPVPMMCPPAEQFAAAMESVGVGDGTRVVLYDGQMNAWAARVWWMLRAFGFDSAAVLDGGWRTWSGEQRPVATGGEAPAPPIRFTPRPRPGLFVTKDDVLGALATTGSPSSTRSSEPSIGVIGSTTAEAATFRVRPTCRSLTLSTGAATDTCRPTTCDKRSGRWWHRIRLGSLRTAVPVWRPRRRPSSSVCSAYPTSLSTTDRCSSGPPIRRCPSSRATETAAPPDRASVAQRPMLSNSVTPIDTARESTSGHQMNRTLARRPLRFDQIIMGRVCPGPVSGKPSRPRTGRSAVLSDAGVSVLPLLTLLRAFVFPHHCARSGHKLVVRQGFARLGEGLEALPNFPRNFS